MLFKEIYDQTVTFMDSYFSDRKSIDLVELESLVSTFVDLLDQENNAFQSLLTMIKTNYSDASHSTNVAYYAIILGREEGYDRKKLIEVGVAALLHDIGKFSIPEEVAAKPSTLTEDEFEMVKQHPIHSQETAKEFGVKDPSILSAIVCHHENYDGTGYPNQLKGKAIPKMGQILAICDAFDALTTDRVFRKRFSVFDALMLIRDERSEHFIPSLIASFFKLFHS